MINDYKAIANNPGANVVDQATYLALLAAGGALQTGYIAGTAQSSQMNKTFRQASVMSAAVAQAISDILLVDVLDDGDVAGLTAKLKSAILSAAWTTGDGKFTFKTVADAGWVLINDGTIGKTGSGATTRANDDTLALYQLLYANVIDTWAPVTGGRSGNSLTDFNNGRVLAIPRQLGRAIVIAGTGAGGLTARVLGAFFGEEKHMQALNELADHLHNIQSRNDSFAGSGHNTALEGAEQQSTIITEGVARGGAPQEGMNVMQPSSFWNVMLKL